MVEGRRLTIPAGVQRTSHNASTFRPYDPNDAIGDASPTTPKPAKNNKCGAFGAILLVVIAVAVTTFLTPIATGAVAGLIGSGLGATVIGTATAAAAGSIVSQGVGVATGIQEKFSWKAVGMAALTATLSGGRSGNFLLDAASAAVTNAMIQGIGVATGLQDKFSWAGVAAAAISAGVTSAVGGKLPSLAQNNSIGNHLRHFGANAAGGIARAASYSVIQGTSFGDNLMGALPDVVGSTVGNALMHGVSVPRPQRGIATDIVITGSRIANWGGEFDSIGSAEANPFEQVALNSAAIAAEFEAMTALPMIGGGGLAGSSAAGALASLTSGGITVNFWSGEFYRSLSERFLHSGYPVWFDSYAGYGGNDPTWVRDMLIREVGSGGPAGAHMNNVIGQLAYLSNKGSMYAGGIALDLLRRQEAMAGSVHSVLTDSAWLDVLPIRFTGDGTIVTNGSPGWLGSTSGAAQHAFYGAAPQVVRNAIALPGPQMAVSAAGMALSTIAAGISEAARPLWPDNEDIVSVQLRQATSHNRISAFFNPTNADRRTMFGNLVVGAATARIPIGAGGSAPVAQVTQNRIAGNAFRDELAALLRAEGRGVETEVYKRTLFGKRYMDIEVSMNGKVLGGIETKVGNSPYTPSQRAKDYWLWLSEGYRVNVVRSPGS